MKWDLDLLQRTLTNNQKLIDALDKKIKMQQMEQVYQKKIKKYSEAYLSGCEWYVGPSLIEYFRKSKYDYSILNYFCIYNIIKSN